MIEPLEKTLTVKGETQIVTQRLVKHASAKAAMDRCVAISVADGYPRPADVRGASCPPHPFGETLLSVEPIKHPELDEWYSPERADLDGVEVTVKGEPVVIHKTDGADVEVDQWSKGEP